MVSQQRLLVAVKQVEAAIAPIICRSSKTLQLLLLTVANPHTDQFIAYTDDPNALARVLT